MAKEGFPRSQERRHEQGREFEIRQCITHERPVASGSNALIFKTEDKKRRSSAQAIKVLKVYRAGAGEHEFKTLSHAYELLAQEKSAAQTPRPSQFVVLELTEEERSHLNSFGAHLANQQPVEAFDMSFIEGKDFARIVYEEVIGRCTPEELIGFLRPDEQPRDLIEEAASLEYLFDIVSHVLKLENPLKVDATGVPQNDVRTLWKNSKKIFEFLTSRGFQVHPSIVSQLDTAVSILHKNGIYHNDLHERNLMIEGRIDDASGKVWILDFGASHRKSSELETYRDDMSLVRLLEACVKTKEERVAHEQHVRKSELEQEILGHLTNPTVVGIFDRFEKLGKENRIQSIARSVAYSLKPKFELSALKLLFDNDVISADEARAIIENALELLTAKNKPATKTKSAVIFNPALQSLLRVAVQLWHSA
jgi:hypothetical protein